MGRYLKRGNNCFYGRNYKDALLYFSLELYENSNSKEARISAILAEFAMKEEEEAIALYEYYLVSKMNGVKRCEEMIEEMINSFELSSANFEMLLFEEEIETRVNEENAIAYEDFKIFIESRGNFKEAFEDIMFSTKIIIYKKDDFLDFLEKLLDSGLKDISMNYIESAVDLYPHDKKLLSLIKKVES